MWEEYLSMPTKTTALDARIDIVKAESSTHISRAIEEATNREAINAKKVDPKPLVPQVELLTWVKQVTGVGRNLDLGV